MKSHAIVGPDSERRANDAYFTDDRVARAVVEHLQKLRTKTSPEGLQYYRQDNDEIQVGSFRFTVEVAPRTILEPSVGGGAFVRACRAVWPDSAIMACDIEPAIGSDALPCEFYGGVDFATFQPQERFDLIIGNPPFKHAAEHIDHAFTLLAPGGVIAMLLPVSFLGGHAKARKDFWTKRGAPKRIDVLYPRPSFTGGGTSAMEFAIMMWGDVPAGNAFINWRGGE